MNEEDKEILKKLRNSPNIDDDDIKKLERVFQQDEVKKSLRRIMEKYEYTVDELKDLLEEIEE